MNLNKAGQFGDGLMVTGKHLIFMNGKETEIKVNMLAFSANTHQLKGKHIKPKTPHKACSRCESCNLLSISLAQTVCHILLSL